MADNLTYDEKLQAFKNELALSEAELKALEAKQKISDAKRNKEFKDIQDKQAIIEAKSALEKSENPDKYEGLKATLADLAAQYSPGASKSFDFSENANFASELISYKIMSKTSDEIGTKICEVMKKSDANPKKIMIVDTLDFIGNSAQLRQIENQTGHWKNILDEYYNYLKTIIDKKDTEQKDDNEKDSLIIAESEAEDKSKEEPEGEAAGAIADTAAKIIPQTVFSAIPAAVGGIINTIAGIAQHLQTEYDIKAAPEYKLPNITFKSEVASKIIDSGKNDSISVNLLGFQHIPENENGSKDDTKKANLVSSLTSCINLCADINVAISFIKTKIADPIYQEIADLNNKLADPEKKNEIETIKAALALKEKIKNQIESEIKHAEKLIESFNVIFTALTTVPEGKNKSPFELCLIQEQIDSLGISHLLFMEVISSKGMSIKAKNIFRCYLRFVGGCVVTYFLVNTSGELLSTGTKYGMDSIRFRLRKDDSFKIN